MIKWLDIILSFRALILIWILFIIIFYFRSDKEYKPSYKDKYYFKLPANYTPCEMSILINYSKLYSKDIIATLTDLIIRKALFITKIISNDSILSSKSSDYKITRNENFNNSQLLEHETLLIKWLINIIGDGKSTTLTQIKNCTRKNYSASAFKNDFNQWCITANKTSKRNKFFKKQNTAIFIGTVISSIYMLSAILMIFILKRYTGLFLIPISILTFIYSINVRKRTTEGQYQYELWMAFKRYIHNLNKDTELKCSISECKKYIPYAISLSTADNIFDYIDVNYSVEDFAISPKELKNFISYSSKTFQVCLKASDFAKSK